MDPPPLDYSLYEDSSPRNSMTSVPGEDERPETELKASTLLLSSTAGISLPDNKVSRRRWGWLKYLCWIIPMIWSTCVYITQVIVGTTTLIQGIDAVHPLGVFNITAGFIGLSLISLQMWDNWYYIKPMAWMTPRELTESDTTPKSVCQVGFVWMMTFVLDTVLFALNVMGSVWAFTLFGTGMYYSPAMMAFSIINIVLSWSRYGALIFAMKVFFRSHALTLLRVV